jgi:hypothetical protein
MNNLIERNINSNVDTLKPKTVEGVTLGNIEISEVLKHIILCSYIMISILSIEGLISWSIGIIGFYKTITIYKSSDQNKIAKAIRLLITFTAVTIVYNLIINYLGKIYS